MPSNQVLTAMMLLLLLASTSPAFSQAQPAQDRNETVRAVIDADGTIRYYVPATGQQATKPAKGDARTLPFDLSGITSQTLDTFKVYEPDNGRVAGYWIGRKPEGVMAVGPGYQLESTGRIQTNQFQYATAMMGWVPALPKDAMKKISKQLMDSAVELGCNDRFRPEDVQVTASIGVVQVAMTWKTATLCR